MPDILTITLNPAVDLATSAEHVVAGPKLYCKNPRVDPGGGGVNVARAICKLGGDALALVVVGGAMGGNLLQLLAAEGVPVAPVSVSGETRQSFAVTDESNGAQYRFSVPGQTLNASEGAQILAQAAEAAVKDGFVVLSGGVAPGLSNDFAQRIQTAIAAKTDRLIVDTSKSALDHLLTSSHDPVLVLRMDRKEAAKAAQHPVETVEDCLSFAQGLVTRGVARIVVIGFGAKGSAMATQNGRFFCQAPDVPVRSTIGAGDAFVGSLTLALSRGDSPETALKWGVAAASATVGTDGTALCDLETTKSWLPACHIEAV